MKQLQIRNPQNVDLLRADFQHRAEPNFAWRAACSMFLALPGLRGFWPMSSIDYTAANRAIDESGQGLHLTDNNTVEFGYDSLAPYVHFTSANSEYLSRADGGAGNWADILGTETYIESAYRGLTLGGWFYFDTLAANDALIAKEGNLGQRSYMLFKDAADDAFFRVSSNGIALLTSGAMPIAATATWYFIVGRFVPSTEVTVFVNNTDNPVVAAVPAAIFDSTTDLRIGARSAATIFPLDGRASMCFLCAAQLSDTIILSLFEQTKAMYGVS